jgi:hypothetical protein
LCCIDFIIRQDAHGGAKTGSSNGLNENEHSAVSSNRLNSAGKNSSGLDQVSLTGKKIVAANSSSQQSAKQDPGTNDREQEDYYNGRVAALLEEIKNADVDRG